MVNTPFSSIASTALITILMTTCCNCPASMSTSAGGCEIAHRVDVLKNGLVLSSRRVLSTTELTSVSEGAVGLARKIEQPFHRFAAASVCFTMTSRLCFIGWSSSQSSSASMLKVRIPQRIVDFVGHAGRKPAD